jgi:hypothetical protein
MKRVNVLVAPIVATIVLTAAYALAAAEKAPQKIVDLANAELAKLGTEPALVAAVKAENAKNKSLDEIKKLDKEWMTTPGVSPFMKSLMENAAAKGLADFAKAHDYCAEMFATDNQGANVAMTDKTSDYWQGDEPKFSECYKNGSGVVFVSDVAFDKSSQAYVVQVSVPVKDGGSTIGVLVISVNVDKFK